MAHWKLSVVASRTRADRDTHVRIQARMDPIAIVFFLIVAIAMLSVRRAYAPVPLLVGCCYMTMGQGLEIGPISLPIYRMFLAVGLMRVLMKGESLTGGLNRVDKLVIALMVWMFFASFFHEFAPGSGPVYISGLIFNISLIYFLIRIWCDSVNGVVGVVSAVAFVLLPVALEMFFEQATAKNLFSFLGGIPETVVERNGRLRAQGPFRHAILAGTVGGTCFPLMLGIWWRNRLASIIGMVACIMMVLASASSGPVISLIVGAAAVLCWKYRRYAKHAVWAGIVGYFVIEMISNRPAYHAIVTRLDITGSSAAHYRARLIDVTIEHFSEWWMFGTDYTSHWIPAGIGSILRCGKHMDITNYYIVFGVNAGLLAILLVLAIIRKLLADVIELVNSGQEENQIGDQFMIWCLGASLFSHAVSSLSIAYFDQSQTFFWLSAAALCSLLYAPAEASAWNQELSEDSEPSVTRDEQPATAQATSFLNR